MRNADMPAMPTKDIDLSIERNDGLDESGRYAISRGLTKREMFAMNAMQGFLSDADYADLYETAPEWRENITKASVEFADRLLKELEK